LEAVAARREGGREVVKVVILAGGRGSRLAEETEIRPKPMVEIGGMPIIWHILKLYSHFGFEEFLIALGYKGSVIKRFFMEYNSITRDFSIDIGTGTVDIDQRKAENWLIHLLDTGLEANTGGRVRALRKHLEEDTFMVTYGDGVANVDVKALLAFHRSQGKLATVTAVRPPARFGGLIFRGDLVAEFTEKPQAGEGWINGGFLVFEPGIFDYLDSDECSLEIDLLERLAREGQLAAYKHEGFWQCMDTIRDKELLQRLWQTNPPWKLWP